MRLAARPLFLLSLLSLPLLGAAAEVDSLAVEGDHVRAVPPGSATTAAFMTLTNAGETDLALVEGASPLAGRLELHNHVMVDGVMQMRRVEAIPLPAGETVRLAPGGWHLMMFELAATPVEGERVELTLTLDNGETMTLEAPVQRVQPMAMDMSGDDQGH
ncbi:copper chaperone PCu(A)C [Halomonas urmiana]|uniref:Copper chaperone PCu(A)C n=1 Tax=Halomonas urmiana TaxID=490901 RepID=A0A5R8MEJ6_9GAMM|nr:copper chaperone PCu(A)C [Halomonas urmiana]TLF48261.1 copper chaperone PCu(A)C [Halomonas urmiana]